MTAVAKTLPGRSLQLDPTPCNVSWNDGTQVLVYGGVSDYCLHIGEGQSKFLHVHCHLMQACVLEVWFKIPAAVNVLIRQMS